MNFRSTVVSLFAGSVIAISSVIGVSADQPVNSSATLIAKQGGKCTAQISNADLGDYTWSGSNYTITGAQPTLNLTVSQDAAPKMTCDVTIQGSTLTRNGKNNVSQDEKIEANQINLTSVNTPGSLASAKFTYPSITNQPMVQNMQVGNMDNALSGKVPGEYTGTISVTTSLVNP